MTEQPIAMIGMSVAMEIEDAAEARGISPSELARMPGIEWWSVTQSMTLSDLLVWYRTRTKLTSVTEDLKAKDTQRRVKNARKSKY